MNVERCKEIIKNRINKIDSEKLMFPDSDDWYDGKKKGLLEALEIIGMINKQNK